MFLLLLFVAFNDYTFAVIFWWQGLLLEYLEFSPGHSFVLLRDKSLSKS